MTVVVSLDAWSSVAVTVLLVVVPPFSGIEAGVSTSVTSGVSSSSVSVTVAPPAGSTDRPDTAPVTVTVSSGSSVVSGSGIRLNSADPTVLLASIVSAKSVTSAKSIPAVAVFPATEIVTSVASSRAEPFSVAVTVTVRALPVAPSDTKSGETVSVSPVDATSSSVMASVRFEGAVTARAFAAVAETVTFLSPSATVLLVAAIVTVPVLAVAPAAMVSVEPLFVKSFGSVLVPAAAETVTVVSSLDGWSRVAVTVLVPPFSEIEAGVSTSVTVGVASLSAIVTVGATAGPTVRPGAVVVPVTPTVSPASSVSSSTGASVNIAVALLSPAGIVTSKGGTAVKSPAVAVTPATVTFTTVASGRAALFSVAVTVTLRAFPVAPSGMLAGETDSVTSVDAVSSSVMVSVCAAGCTIFRSLVAVPETVTLLSPV